jgi:PPE-repeat protein
MLMASNCAFADMEVVANNVVGVEAPQFVGNDLYYVSWAKETVNKCDDKSSAVDKSFLSPALTD